MPGEARDKGAKKWSPQRTVSPTTPMSLRALSAAERKTISLWDKNSDKQKVDKSYIEMHFEHIVRYAVIFDVFLYDLGKWHLSWRDKHAKEANKTYEWDKCRANRLQSQLYLNYVELQPTINRVKLYILVKILRVFGFSCQVDGLSKNISIKKLAIA